MSHRPGGVFLDPGSSAQHIVRPDKPKLGWSLEQRKVYYKSYGRRMGGWCSEHSTSHWLSGEVFTDNVREEGLRCVIACGLSDQLMVRW